MMEFCELKRNTDLLSNKNKYLSTLQRWIYKMELDFFFH